MSISKTIKKWVTQILGRDYFVVEIDYAATNSKAKIDILIDGDKGVSTGKCEEVMLALKRLIDEAGLLSAYALNISSPSLDRPLTLVRQCRQYIGKTLRIEENPDPERGYQPLITEGTLISIKKNILLIHISKNQKIEVNFELQYRITVVNDFY
jgi:ribosome maturation factor RimP